MKLHLVTVGKPKLPYAVLGWDDYLSRLQRLHTVRVTHLSDKYAYDTTKLLDACQNSYRVGLVIDSSQYSSEELAKRLEQWESKGKEVSLIIGGPEGLPQDFIAQLDEQWSLSKLTFPHDLAMVVTLEALFRASTIKAGIPYHK